MHGANWIRPVFAVAALYDGVLGLAFLLVPLRVFDYLQIPPPNHVAYVQFPAALLCVFAVMLLQIARNPIAGRQLIPYCILLKIAYCGVAGWHWASAEIPAVWKIFAIIDAAIGVLFLLAYAALPRTNTRRAADTLPVEG